MANQDKILDVLLQLAPTVAWLHQAEPISASLIPAEHLGAMKQLENLGLVYRRGRNCALQRLRLVKMLNRESQSVFGEKREQFLAAYALVLEIPATPEKDASSPHGMQLATSGVVDV